MKAWKRGFLWFISFIPLRFSIYIQTILRLGYVPNFNRPTRYSEKINFIKLKSDFARKTEVADRLMVRKYVEQKKTSCRLIPLLWTGKDFPESIYNELPEKFVIKANHGSGMVKVVDKKNDTYDKILRILKKWQAIDFGSLTGERFYSHLEKYFVVEQFMQNPISNSPPPDFKFHCSRGSVVFIQVDNDRFTDHTRDIYDVQFNRIDVSLGYPMSASGINMPKLFSEALLVAEILSQILIC